MSDHRIIRLKIRKILPTLDLETATQRTIQQQLEHDLDMPLDDYKSIIKSEVDAWLLGIAPDEMRHEVFVVEDQEEQEQFPPPPPGAVPSPNNNNGPPPDHPPPAKKPRQEQEQIPNKGPGDFIYSAPISNNRYAGVKLFNNKAYVDVREFYEKENTLLPGTKGLLMNTDQWSHLTAGLPSINEALSRSDDTFFVDLGSNRRAAVGSLPGGKVIVALREYYDKDGKMFPGKKGISLTPEQYAKLCAVHEVLSIQLRTLGGRGSTGGGTATRQPSTKKEEGEEQEEKGPIPTGLPPAQPPQQQKTVNSSGPLFSVSLSSLRRVEVTRWKGNVIVDLREFYEKNGELAHSKKGLQLTPAQFTALADAEAAITTAFQSKDTSFELLLSPKRKVTVSEYKGRCSVDVREYFEKEGKLLPTQKGLSMPEDQWNVFRGSIQAIKDVLLAQQ